MPTSVVNAVAHPYAGYIFTALVCLYAGWYLKGHLSDWLHRLGSVFANPPKP